MIFVRPLTKEEEKELRRMTRQEAGRVSHRARMVLLSAGHWTVPQIALVFAASRATVRFWIRQFEAEGPAGLFDDDRTGRPRKISLEVEQKLVEWLEEDPHQAHERFLATSWTVPMLVIALATYLNIAVCCNTVRNGLRRLRLRWGRPRLAMPQKTDPEKTRKQWAMVKAVVDAGPDAAILYGDESRVQTLALIRAMWHWIGQQLRVPTPGSNTARALFGALNIRTGEWTHMVRQRMRKEDFIAFLEHLLVVYPSQTILLIVDNYSSHTAFEVTSWLEHHPRLQLHFLPKYCSHLNPVESIWLRMKNCLAGNRLYGSIRILLDTLDSFLDTMTPEIALRWAGIKSNRNLLRPT